MENPGNMLPPENALFAVPKKGRLYERCMKLLDGAGIQYRRPDRLDIAQCSGLPITLVFLPAHDIASYVGEGNVDMGITGLDVIEETGQGEHIDVAMELGFGKCKLCVLAPKTAHVTDPSTLAGQRIVTSFPGLTRKYFDQYDKAGKPTGIKFVSGSVEAACGLGLADAVVDLVETGTTMRAAGLEIVAEVMETQCLLITSKHTKHKEMVQLITSRVAGFITAERHLMISYNVQSKDLQAVIAITPGKRAPTVTSLSEEGWLAVQALIEKKKASSIMDELTKAGAADILCFSLQNTRC
ncbi:unnamed protein product [Chrysoparadoxa australica]